MDYALAAFFYCAGLCATQMAMADLTHPNRLVHAALLLLWPVPILGTVILVALDKDQ
jgi:hypothetical protein